MPLAFASSLGGVLTLIGTAPNLIARQSLMENGYQALSFFAFTPVGLILLFAGIAYLLSFGRKWLYKPREDGALDSNTSSLDELLQKYQLEPYLHYTQVPDGHSMIGKKLKELDWPNKYGLTMLEALKKDRKRQSAFGGNSYKVQQIGNANYQIEEGDVLLVHTDVDALNKFVEETGLKKASLSSSYLPQLNVKSIAEVIFTPQSRLINQSLRDSRIRDKYGLTVLAIKRRNQEPRPSTGRYEPHYGDVMLVYGKRKDIDLLSEEKSDMVVIRHAPKPPELANQAFRSIVAGIIVLLMLIMLVLEWIPSVISVVIAALLMILTGCIRHTDHAYRSVNWQVVVLIACMLPMATALEKTGGIAFLSEKIISTLGTLGPLAVLAGLYAVTSVFSQFISNTATAVLLFPVAILTAQEMGVSAIPMVMGVAYSASMAFATPVATPPNAMVMVAGKYTFADYLRVGVPLQIILGIIAVLLIPIFFPF